MVRGFGGVWLFTGKGGGVFNPGVQTPTPAYMNPGTRSTGLIAAADFNGDGYLDVVVSFATTTSGFVLLLGNGNGTFQAPMTFTIPPSGAE